MPRLVLSDDSDHEGLYVPSLQTRRKSPDDVELEDEVKDCNGKVSMRKSMAEG